jgi:hypothetical protein
MKNSKTFVKRAAIVLLVGTGLAGCIAVPVYDSPRAYGPVLAPAIVVGPVFRPYYGGGGYRGGYYGGGRGRW